MSIKKSFLEQKWYYRVAKILFLWVIPILVVSALLLVIYANRRSNITADISSHVIFVVGGLLLYYLILKVIWRGFLYIIFGGLENDTKKPIAKIVKSVNSVVPPVQSVQTPNQAGAVVGLVFFVILIIIIAKYSTGSSLIFSDNHTYGTSCTDTSGKNGLYGTNGSCLTCSSDSVAVTSPVNNCSNGIAGVYCCNNSSGSNGGNGGSKCIPTGCGNLWDCWGDYYPASGVRTHVSGCFATSQEYLPSWSGTCKQCQ